jgi:hypothetical protein
MLSARATEYLSRLERRPLISDADEVRAVFASRSLPCPTAITDFQSRFGGVVMYACLAPMIATILHPQANFLLDRPWNVPDVSEDDGKLMFNCIDTLYQMEFHLDETGQYYEDWSPVHQSFDKFLEGEALLASHSKHGRWSMIADPETEVGRDEEQLRRYGLEMDEFASCRYTTFWYNDAIIVRYRLGHVAAWRNE